jgi:hypothetical protein
MLRLLAALLLGFVPAGHSHSSSPAAGNVAAPAAAPAHAAPALLAELRRGGYVLYFRHTATDFSQDDSASRAYDDCARQRNLTGQGRDEARAIGAAIRALEIPIGKVVASPLCRTMETARLAFGRAEASHDTRGGPLASAPPARYAALRRLLATPLPPGTNLVISSHGNPFFALAGPPYLAEGEAAVVRGLGDDRFEIVARVRHDGWRALETKR